MASLLAFAGLLIGGAILLALFQIKESIMSQISDFAAAVNTSFTAIRNGLNGLSADVQHLKDEIAKLTPSPEDAALLEGIKAEAEALATSIAALDDQTTPPTPPTE